MYTFTIKRKKHLGANRNAAGSLVRVMLIIRTGFQPKRTTEPVGRRILQVPWGFVAWLAPIEAEHVLLMSVTLEGVVRMAHGILLIAVGYTEKRAVHRVNADN